MSPETEQRARVEEIFKKFHKRITGALQRRWQDKAEDKAQEAIMILMQNSQVREEGDLIKLLYGIKRMLALSAVSHKREPDQPPPVTGADGFMDDRPNPEELAQKNEMIRKLRAAVQQLGTRCRELLRLRLQDWESGEIAKALGMSASTLYVTEHRCRQELRALMLQPAALEGGRNA